MLFAGTSASWSREAISLPPASVKSTVTAKVPSVSLGLVTSTVAYGFCCVAQVTSFVVAS
ncbi:hypothetical protein ACFQ1B_16455 [Streptomyces mexicanus]